MTASSPHPVVGTSGASSRARALPLARTLSMADADQLATDLEVFAHPVRAKILDILVRKGTRVCVCHIEADVPVKQPTVSHHLRLLREAGVVQNERDGHWMYYSVNREALDAVRARISRALGRFA